MAATRNQKVVSASQRQMPSPTVATIPAFPNTFPYNELLLDGKLDINGFGVKSRSWAWKHRGLVLLYTSGRVDWTVAEAYGLDPKEYPRGMIVGAAELVDVRRLTKDEIKALVCRFNNTEWEKIRRCVCLYPNCDGDYFCGVHYASPRPVVVPYHLGFFFKNLVRFEQSVPFAWPMGAVRNTNVPVAVVAAALKRVGIRI